RVRLLEKLSNTSRATRSRREGRIDRAWFGSTRSEIVWSAFCTTKASCVVLHVRCDTGSLLFRSRSSRAPARSTARSPIHSAAVQRQSKIQTTLDPAAHRHSAAVDPCDQVARERVDRSPEPREQAAKRAPRERRDRAARDTQDRAARAQL